MTYDYNIPADDALLALLNQVKFEKDLLFVAYELGRSAEGRLKK